MKTPREQILVTGGAGYVGACLVPKLLDAGYPVKVLDLFMYGDHVFDDLGSPRNLECIRGDIRDKAILDVSLRGVDAVIHLACISNDPSYELNPELGRSINFYPFRPLVELARRSGVKRFIFASSSSVYGVKTEANVTEDMALESLTDYSKYKALCEKILLEYQSPEFTTCILRPATVCGYSPRQRLDLTVNILTNLAYHTGRITIFGGNQKRPNIHIQDMVRAYLHVLEQPKEKIAGQIYNVGYENFTVRELAEMVKEVVGPRIEMITTPTDDHRSYHISSEKMKMELGFLPAHTIQDAIRDVVEAFEAGRIPNAMTDKRYYNIKTMQALNLK